MKYVFTKHVKERMRLRKVSRREVMNTIRKYDKKTLENEKENKVAFYKKRTETQVLKIVAIEEKVEIRIITVHPIGSERLKNIKNLIEIK